MPTGFLLKINFNKFYRNEKIVLHHVIKFNYHYWRNNMQKLILRKLVAIVLIVSMIFTMGGFVTLAESISDVVESSKDESEDKSDLSHKYYDDLVGASNNVGASTDNVEASTASPSFAEDEDIENDEEQDSNTYEEEPDETYCVTNCNIHVFYSYNKK